MPTTAQKKVTLLEQYYEAFLRSLNPTAWLPLTDAGSISKNAAYTAAPGANVVVNGTFATDTVWVKGTGWTIGSGVATHAAGTGSDLSQASILTTGDTYRTTLTVSGRTAGTLDVKHGSTSRLTISANGTYLVDGIADGTGLVLTASAAFDGSVDDVTAQLIGQLDALNTAATVGQTGKLGTAHAYDFDGATSLLTVTNSATLAGMANQKWGFLAKADTLGETSNGAFAAWGNLALGTDHTVLKFAGTNQIRADFQTSLVTASAVSNINQIQDCLTVWAWYFMDYDDADSLGNGRRIRLFKGLNGTVTQLTLATNTAATGTLDSPTTDLIIGNKSGADFTFDGLMDEVLVKSGSLWTTAEMQTLVNLTRV